MPFSFTSRLELVFSLPLLGIPHHSVTYTIPTQVKIEDLFLCTSSLGGVAKRSLQ